MYGSTSPPSLIRRLVGGYMVVGLAGLFSFLTLTLVLAWRGQLTELTSLTVVLPLGILLTGTLVLRRVAWVNSQVEEQLVGVAESRDASLGLRPILSDDPVAAGWNSLRERLATQESLADLERRLLRSVDIRDQGLRGILDLLPDGVAVTDAGGKMTFVNPACAAILGGSPDGMLGRPLAELLMQAFPENAAQLQSRLSPARAQSVAEARRGRETAAGVVRISRSRASGGGERSVWCFHDITQQKLAEEARNQFVLTATHELRTPLTNIKALADMISLEDEIDVEEQKRFCNIINAEATRLARFVDELLDLNQLEAGALSIVRSETDLERLLGEVVAHVRPEVERKRIDFAASLPPKLPKLSLDKDKFVGALVNLLGNAVKYTPDEGRVRLNVEVDDRQVSLTIEDSGIGISEEDLPHIFEKFFRSGDDRVREITGSGLGLAFTQEVVCRHGGRINVSSEIGRGSRFTVLLPLPKEEVSRV